MSFQLLWRNESHRIGIFYILNIHSDKIKIGITSKSITKRYGKGKSLPYEIVKEYSSSINHCFQIEQLIKIMYKGYSILKTESVNGFGWTETFNSKSLNMILEFCDKYFNNTEETTKLFKETFNLTYEDRF